VLVAYSSAAKRKNREHAGNETSRPMPEDSRQVAKMEAKKFFTYLRLVFSVIFSIDLFHFIVIIWTYISTNSISVHHSVNLIDLHLSEYENLNVRNRS